MSNKERKNKIIVIVGTTASGKTKMAVDLAYKFRGEIISADSRQVYKYMDVGTGKDLHQYKIEKNDHKTNKKKFIEIPYRLIDIVHPNTEYNLVKWKKQAELAVKEILKKGRVPIVAGGTGLYTQALVDNFNLSDVGPNMNLRKSLEEKSVKELFGEVETINKKFAENLHDSDKKNKRRLIRYIEVLKNSTLNDGLMRDNDYDYFIIGLTWPREVLRRRIYNRLITRLEKEDMVKEVEELHKKYKVSWRRLESFGLEYKYISLYLQKKLTYKEMVDKLNTATVQFAKRQITWLRRWEKQGRKIYWLESVNEAKKIVNDFLNKK